MRFLAVSGLLSLSFALGFPAFAMGVDTGHVRKSTKCVADAVFHESRGEVYEGQVGVAYVVKSRSIASGKSPCSVVHEHKGGSYQFKFMENLKPVSSREMDNWTQAVEVADRVMSGKISDPVSGAQFFHRCRIGVRHKDQGDFHFVRQIGNHCYYRDMKTSDKYADVVLTMAKFDKARHHVSLNESAKFSDNIMSGDALHAVKKTASKKGHIRRHKK